MCNPSELKPGLSFPLGATVQPDGAHQDGAHPDGAYQDSAHQDGVNFCVFSKNSTSMELLLFDDVDAPQPARIIPLDPQQNRTFYYWHIFVPGLKPGQIYAYRAGGPFDPPQGHYFDREKVLLDPYGRNVAIGKNFSRAAAIRPGNNAAHAIKSVVVDPQAYDWESDIPLHRPFYETIIYEMHVGGFTRHPNSGVSPEKRGTYAGLAEKIPYLQDLGVTAVELLPIFQFDEQDAPPGLVNYWGYSPISFFAPHRRYSSRQDLLGPLDEFRDMVKALHRAGIEVILDVVYNHTAEGNQNGPTYCFRGLENRAYYILEQGRTKYANYSGTGNTLNANQSVVRRMILDSLHYWVQDMHVDGFRFDLASILSRDEQGLPLLSPPILWDIESDPVLAGTKLIAEAWDAGGLYQVGSFIGDRWKEWNGMFRDDVRSFVKSDKGMVSKLATRFLASPDLYAHELIEPEQSINFVTCHDGFTLNDLVSYNQKHNQANLENNRDGYNHNLSWNCGVEGATDHPQVEKLRVRQIKNFFTINLLALGVPMLLMGDEVRRTQLGNNNAYCQDNELSWFDWSLPDKHADIYRFVKQLINLRLNLSVFKQRAGVTLDEFLHQANIQWHGVKLNRPDWSCNSHSLAFTVKSYTGVCWFHVVFNAYWAPLEFELPPSPGNHWHRIIDTYLASPDDFCNWHDAPPVTGSTYLVKPRSVVLLAAEIPNHI